MVKYIMPVTISKSKYLNGLQCPKLLWYIYNAKEELPKPDDATEAVFEQGHEIGAYAKKLFPKGIEVDHSNSRTFAEGLQSTQEILKKRVPVFEAALAYKNTYARADILVPSGRDAWELIEVKSATSLKDIYLCDIGFQYHVYTQAGLKITKCSLMCIDNTYVRKGKIDPKKLFKKMDVTKEVTTEYSRLIENNVKDMLAVIGAAGAPAIDIGAQCSDPYECPLTEKCWAFLPERNVFLLKGGRTLAFELVKKGILELKKIPGTCTLNDKQKIQLECERTGKPYIDKEKLKKFLGGIKYPVYYMDFETWMTAIPLFDGLRPYQQVPFQFSVHVVKKQGAAPEHYSFLVDGTDDPRPAFMKELKKVMGARGSVVAFNARFERDRLKECAAALPGYKAWVSSIEKRMIDLLDPFKAFAYHHHLQDGSNSLKYVLPALAGKSYEGMEIGDGGTASREYFRITFTEDNADKAEVRRLLEEYCCLDTLGMVDIVNTLAASLKK